MKYGMKNILFSLFVLSLICPVAAQTADTDRPVVDNTIALREIQSSFFSVSTQKTFHLIFPNEVKYFSIGDENVAGEKIEAYPCAIRLKSVVQSFEGLTNMSVVTADGQYYSYNVSFVPELQETYLQVGRSYMRPPVIAVNDNQQSHLIFPDKIMYVDYRRMWKLSRLQVLTILLLCGLQPLSLLRRTCLSSPNQASSILLI